MRKLLEVKKTISEQGLSAGPKSTDSPGAEQSKCLSAAGIVTNSSVSYTAQQPCYRLLKTSNIDVSKSCSPGE